MYLSESTHVLGPISGHYKLEASATADLQAL